MRWKGGLSMLLEDIEHSHIEEGTVVALQVLAPGRRAWSSRSSTWEFWVPLADLWLGRRCNNSF